jgi:heat-inducible transcriptional repressor
VLRQIELIPLTPGRVLAIAVTEAGLVHERLLSVDPALKRADLERFTNFLNSLLPGRLLGEVRGVLEAALREAREKRDELEQRAAELGKRALDGDVDEAEILVEGASRVLAQREFTENPQLASELMRAVEEREVWLQLLASVEATGDTRVYVGEEAPSPALASCGLVVTRWTTGHASGVVAVFGPKRLDYRRAIPLVAQVARRLGGVLDGERGA